MIGSPQEFADPASRPKRSGTLTWHFRMENTRDVAWSESSSFAWDAARINLPGGKSSLAMSIYPAASKGNDRWGRTAGDKIGGESVRDSVSRDGESPVGGVTLKKKKK